jgi:hypothetical protein
MKLVDKLWKICHHHTYITVDGAWTSERLWLLFILLALLFLFKFYPSVYFCVVLQSLSGSLALMSRNFFLLCSGFLKCEYVDFSVLMRVNIHIIHFDNLWFLNFGTSTFEFAGDTSGISKYSRKLLQIYAGQWK